MLYIKNLSKNMHVFPRPGLSRISDLAMSSEIIDDSDIDGMCDEKIYDSDEYDRSESETSESDRDSSSDESENDSGASLDVVSRGVCIATHHKK